MSRMLAVSLLAVLLALVAPVSPAGSASRAHASKSCSGKVTRKINRHRVHARSIATRNVSCRRGKRVLRRFLGKANRKPGCNRRSRRPPPNSGCAIARFNCFRNGSTYCASPVGKEVSWKE